MTTTQTETRDDQFAYWDTNSLIGICFRVTPAAERDGWVVTSSSRYDENGRELYTRQQLRDFAVEQLECQGITIHDVNQMKS